MYVYKLAFANGKVYIGQTVWKIERRYARHKQCAADPTHTSAVYNAWRKYGPPTLELISEHDTLEELNAAEVAEIDRLNCRVPGGYNLHSGGGAGGSVHPVSKDKLRATNTGRVFGPEVRAKVGAATLQHWRDPEYRERVTSGLRAAWTPEMRQERGELARRVHTGAKRSEETKAKLRGRVFSEETRRKMSESAKKRVRAPMSEETKAKLGEAIKKSHSGSARGAAIGDALRRRHAQMTEEQRLEFSETRKRAWATRRAKQAAKQQLQTTGTTPTDDV